MYLRLVDHEQPWLLAGAPPCGPFSILMTLQQYNRDPEKDRQRLEWGGTLLNVACQGYRRQCDNGRYFLHEAPSSASSWKEDCIMKLMALPGVVRVDGPMCRWGMHQHDQGNTP